MTILLISPWFSNIAYGNHADMQLCEDFDETCSPEGVFLWSKDVADGHLGELICETANPERCKVPYDLDNNIDNIGMTLFDIVG
jgi:hypothetical protein